MGLYLILGLFGLVGFAVQSQLRSKFRRYSQVPISTGMSGAETAHAMLRHYGLTDVQIVEGRGTLTDHYNPKTKTVALSPDVYHGRSVAAAAVAAHECGHAVQHSTQYSMLQFRSGIVPVVQIASSIQTYVFMAALLLLGSFPQLMLIAIASYAVTTLFSFVTLPVEFDASKRALVWLDNAGVTHSQAEYDGAKDALKWAGMTYVVAALSSLVMLIYLILRFTSR